MYPKINDLVRLLHSRGISTFLVTNAQFPDAIKYVQKKPVKPIYVVYHSLLLPLHEFQLPLTSRERFGASLGCPLCYSNSSELSTYDRTFRFGKDLKINFVEVNSNNHSRLLRPTQFTFYDNSHT